MIIYMYVFQSWRWPHKEYRMPLKKSAQCLEYVEQNRILSIAEEEQRQETERRKHLDSSLREFSLVEVQAQ